MDLSVLNNISYGMYIITTKKEHKNVGCFINSAMQITSKSKILAISLNKDNYTNEVLKETRKCAISILNEKANQKLISKFGYFSSREINKFDEVKSKFGYFSSREINKFDEVNYQNINELPVVIEDCCGYIIGEVIRVIDVETHDIFLIRIEQMEKLSDDVPMTYRYYHEVLKGKSPKKAPTYQEEKEEGKANRYQCSTCGYIYDDSKEKIKFEDLPDNWTCPMCGVGKDKFIKL